MIYELVLQARGWDEGWRLVARMAGNARRIYHHAAEVPIEVGAGEIALGTTIDSYAWAQIEQMGEQSIGFVAPEGESLMNPDAIAVLRGAPHAELARAFVEFTLSPAGQALWMLPRRAPGGPERYPLGRMPVRPDVYRAQRERTAVRHDPFAEHEVLAYDPDLGSARWSVVNGLVGAALIDLHRELREAWAEVVAAGRPAEAEELLTRPPATEAEVRALGKEFRDALRRNDALARIASATEARYRRARDLARAARGRS
jgi:hypothetical protein